MIMGLYRDYIGVQGGGIYLLGWPGACRVESLRLRFQSSRSFFTLSRNPKQ